MTKTKLTAILTAITLIASIMPGLPTEIKTAEASPIEFCLTGTDVFVFPFANTLTPCPPAGPLVVLEPDSSEGGAAVWSSAPLASATALLAGSIDLDIVVQNYSENEPGDDVCFSKRIRVPGDTDPIPAILVATTCVENPFPVTGFTCPVPGAIAPLPAGCTPQGLLTLSAPNLVAPMGVPAGSIVEVRIWCPGSSFVGVYFNDATEFGVSEIAEPEKPAPAPATMGFWKNHEADTTALLPQTLGGFVVPDFATASAVFDAASAKNANDMLAAQLLAAKLNKANGAVSLCIDATIVAADAALVAGGYAGPGAAGIPTPDKATVNALKDALDAYNNGLLC